MKPKRRRVQRNPLPNQHHPDPETCDRIGRAARRLIDLTEPLAVESMTVHSLDGCWRISFTKISERPAGRDAGPAAVSLPGLRAA